MGDVFQFLKQARRDGDKTDAQVRKHEFREIYALMDTGHAQEQADQQGPGMEMPPGTQGLRHQAPSSSSSPR